MLCKTTSFEFHCPEDFLAILEQFVLHLFSDMSLMFDNLKFFCTLQKIEVCSCKSCTIICQCAQVKVFWVVMSCSVVVGSNFTLKMCPITALLGATTQKTST
jgi:hypothetical protein